jgi:hypothetical protein
MSVDLDIKMNHPVQSDELLEDTKLVLMSLLNLDECPDLSIKRRKNGREEQLGSERVLLEGASYPIGLPGTEAFTELVLYKVEALRGVPESQSGSHGAFSLSGCAPHLSFALAASGAIAFARRQGAGVKIWDSATIWIRGAHDEHTVDEFVEGLATQGWFVDLKKQAKALFERKT